MPPTYSTFLHIYASDNVSRMWLERQCRKKLQEIYELLSKVIFTHIWGENATPISFLATAQQRLWARGWVRVAGPLGMVTCYRHRDTAAQWQSCSTLQWESDTQERPPHALSRIAAPCVLTALVDAKEGLFCCTGAFKGAEMHKVRRLRKWSLEEMCQMAPGSLF